MNKRFPSFSVVSQLYGNNPEQTREEESFLVFRNEEVERANPCEEESGNQEPHFNSVSGLLPSCSLLSHLYKAGSFLARSVAFFPIVSHAALYIQQVQCCLPQTRSLGTFAKNAPSDQILRLKECREWWQWGCRLREGLLAAKGAVSCRNSSTRLKNVKQAFLPYVC